MHLTSLLTAKSCIQCDHTKIRVVYRAKNPERVLFVKKYYNGILVRGCLGANCLFFLAGQKYYYNTKTNETRWERPRGAAPAAAEDSSENHVSTGNGDVSSAATNGPKFKKCLGCQGWGRGLVQAWGYCNHCTRCESFMILTHICTYA